ncbi:hypothetical protein FNT36_03245 [Hymenobacter setariae]|uniref:Uncharacterized protein n=1 Tax=Hymenobacter setariae TaxID=2594794 RepID=A0A558C390_9BACT|nr:hypothetical protein [Hymenobacter setariae]TVT43122.1 hypothetical protein FNT36_03245 [Hymenobacter setariae]
MKHFLLAGLLLAAIPTLAQTAPPAGQEAAQPTKRDNVIILHTTDSVAVAYSKLGRVLLDGGYPIDRSDKELGYINTSYRPTQNRAVEAAYRFSIKPSKEGAIIEVRGMCKMPSMRLGDTPIDYRGAFGSAPGIAWQEMSRLALSYKAPVVTYKRQN